MNENKWVLDVTLDYPCYCPYDTETGDIITGMNYVGGKCPGELIGVVHLDGEEHLNKWIEENRDLYTNILKANRKPQNK